MIKKGRKDKTNKQVTKKYKYKRRKNRKKDKVEIKEKAKLCDERKK